MLQRLSGFGLASAFASEIGSASASERLIATESRIGSVSVSDSETASAFVLSCPSLFD
jgi:hypothetical protein